MTGLMYNRRVAKSHPRVAAYGNVDELNAALGLARASATHDFVLAWTDGGKLPGLVEKVGPRTVELVDKAVVRPITERLCFIATRGVC